jgi:hypothetical protein
MVEMYTFPPHGLNEGNGKKEMRKKQQLSIWIASSPGLELHTPHTPPRPKIMETPL